ncbi:hypothetical protein TWF481_006151 [Arthrobotrys musiformis]|uniref:Clr5 domain-containing protein n=1 Tax=Arthrobotrys musiformis TaxID=47236 RepID=A0AAV9WHV5_9PEZI
MSSSRFNNFKPYDGTRVQKRGYRKNEVWDEHKDFILDLVQRGEKQKNILAALKNERGFDTNLNQLKSKLGIWGASSKNLSKKQRKWIYLMNQHRHEMGKETIFYFGDTGFPVTESQMGSIMKGGEREFSAMDDIPASPGELEMTTPPPMDLADGEAEDYDYNYDISEDQMELIVSTANLGIYRNYRTGEYFEYYGE